MGSTTDLYHSVYSGTCGSIGAALVCSDPNSSTLTGLTIGNTYFVRVYSWTGTNGQTTTFDICIGTPPPPPVNDECTGAIGLTVNPNNLCGTTTAGTIASATPSAQTNGCGGTADDDVWYSFVATSTLHLVSLLNVVGSTTDLYHSVYSGTCGSIGTALVCSDPNSSTITGLTVGNTYFVRVYSWTGTNGQTTTFDICIGTPPPPPTNDDCTGAIGVPVNPDNLCGSVTTGTIASASASSQTNGCGGTANDDVWYSFVATGTAHIISLLNITGGTTDLYHSVYSGTCASIGTELVCSDPNSSVVSGLTIGNTYYVRIFSWTGTTGQTSVFDLCVGTPPPPPPNDNCAGAVTVSVNSGACSPITSSVYSATASANANGCSGTANDDVWFTFTATTTDIQIDLLNVSGSTTDLYHSVYAGTCGALGAELVCSDPNSSQVNSLTIGSVYFVRVYSWTGTAGQTTLFDICISEIGPCGVTSTTEDFCPYSATITQALGSWSSNTSSSYTADVPGNINAVFCGSIENNSWYEFTAIGTTEVFNITSVINCTSGIQAEVYEVTYDAGGCCTGFTSVSNCFNPGTAATGTVTATGLTAGNTYMLMVDGFAGDNCDFTVSNWTATGILLPVELIDLKAVGMSRKNVVSWKTVTENNSHYFNVLRSFDGINFSQVGTIDAAGESTQLISYEFIDANVQSGLVYYQLEQFDINGGKNTTDIVSLNRNTDHGGILAARPNPTENNLFVEVKPNVSQVAPILQLIDSRGLIIRQNGLIPGELNIINMNLSDLASGVYFLMHTDYEGIIHSQKILKK